LATASLDQLLQRVRHDAHLAEDLSPKSTSFDGQPVGTKKTTLYTTTGASA
jgi:hypothetical protein